MGFLGFLNSNFLGFFNILGFFKYFSVYNLFLVFFKTFFNLPTCWVLYVGYIVQCTCMSTIVMLIKLHLRRVLVIPSFLH